MTQPNSLTSNLDNFEDSIRLERPYVLTSPDSLIACQTLGIKPVNLLYKSLEQHEESFCSLPLSEIYKIYEERETKRQEDLLKCKELRTKLKKEKRMKKNSMRNAIDESAHDGSNDRAIMSDLDVKKELKKFNKDLKTCFKPTNTKYRAKSAKNFESEQLLEDKSPSQSALLQLSPYNLKPLYVKNIDTEGDETSWIQNSDTESANEINKGLKKLKKYKKSYYLSSNPYKIRSNAFHRVRSLPDVTKIGKRLDLKKIATSPRECLCRYGGVDDLTSYEHYLNRYNNILSSNNLSPEDRKILRLWILKKHQEIDRDNKSWEMRHFLENETLKRLKEKELLQQEWYNFLLEKRHAENALNIERYDEIKRKWLQDREKLIQFLDERDLKFQTNLEDITYKKRRDLLQRQKREAIRQLDVSNTLDKMIQEDHEHRQRLRLNLEKKLEEAALRKRRQEMDYNRHLKEMNRLEESKRLLRLERLEQQSRQAIEELREQIREKEIKARRNHLRRQKLEGKISNGEMETRNEKLWRVKTLHDQLMEGLEEWHKKVLELNLEAQEKAKEKHLNMLSERRAKTAERRILREARNALKLKQVHELEEARRGLIKESIQQKEDRYERLKAEKDREMTISRIRAQNAADVREQLKEKLNPTTFDKKVARVEMECQVMKRKGDPMNSSVQLRKPIGYPVKATSSVGIKLFSCNGGNVKRGCGKSITCCCNDNRRRHSTSHKRHWPGFRSKKYAN